MIEQKAEYKDISENKPSQLRREFEDIEGRLVDRSLDFKYVEANEIVGLGERPGFSPTLSLIQIKGRPDGTVIMYSQDIHISNLFLLNLELSLRKKAVKIKSTDNDYEVVPKGYESHYILPFTQIPVEYTGSVSQEYVTKSGFEQEIKDMYQIDPSGFPTLGLLAPQAMEDMLDDIEEKVVFTASIQDVTNPSNWKLQAYEAKKANGQMVVYHYVFLSQSNEGGGVGNDNRK